MTVTKNTIARELASVHGCTIGTMERIIDDTCGIIAEAMNAGTHVQLIGFGTFRVTERGARTARNPRTGESVSVPARRILKFKPAKALHDAMNQSAPAKSTDYRSGND